MTTLGKAQREFQKKLVNANGYIFAVVLLTVGMYVITGFWLWFAVALPVIWLFGVCSAAVIGGKIAYKRGFLDDEEDQ